MRTRGRRRKLGVGLCAVVVGLAVGCGDGSDGGSGDSSDRTAGPLAEFLGYEDLAARRGPGEFTERERQQHYEVQEYIVECMNEAGFEYHPQPFWGDREEADRAAPNEDVWQLQQDDPEEFARQYGYGMTTVDRGGAAVEAPDPEPADDPNLEYRESLSPEAQEEYQKALYGDMAAIEQRMEEGEEPPEELPEPGGCQNDANQEVYGSGQELQDQFGDLFEAMQALTERVQDDARLTDATRSWASCMADAGYPDITELDEGRQRVAQRRSELYGMPAPVVEGEGESSGSAESAASAAPTVPVEPDGAELEELREFELDLAWADYTCQQEHEVEQTRQDVRFEMEEQFIEDHRAQLEEYRDWLREQGRVG